MKILFVCTGNTCRSPMAEHLFKKMLSEAGLDHVSAQSAGLSPAVGIAFPREAQEALRDEGVPHVTHTPQTLCRKMVEDADLVLVMEGRHRDFILGLYPQASNKVHLLKAYAQSKDSSLSISDPFGGTSEEYRKILGEIKGALIQVIAKIKAEKKPI